MRGALVGTRWLSRAVGSTIDRPRIRARYGTVLRHRHGGYLQHSPEVGTVGSRWRALQMSASPSAVVMPRLAQGRSASPADRASVVELADQRRQAVAIAGQPLEPHPSSAQAIVGSCALEFETQVTKGVAQLRLGTRHEGHGTLRPNS